MPTPDLFDGGHADTAWDEMGQRYPEYDINTIARVMAAANLAYCPDRLT